MIKFIKNSKLLLIILLISNSVACASDKSELIKASDLFCSFYDPKGWGDLTESGDTYSIYNLIAMRQEQEIKNIDFKAVLSAADTSDFDTYFISVKDGIEKAIGKTWKCKYFDQFYMPTQTVMSLTLNDVKTKRIDPNSDQTIVIAIAFSGDILIGNAPLKSVTQEIIIAALQSKIKQREINKLNFVLYFDEGANGSLLPRVLRSLRSVGVEKVDMIDN